MNRLRGFQDLADIRGCVLSIGNFDGIHRGHQAILASLAAQARQHAVCSVVLTFEPHPATLLNPARTPPRLTTADSKAELIAASGIDALVEYAPDWELLRLSPQEFFNQIILEKFNATGLVEGTNFFFGKDRTGNEETLRSLCGAAGRFLEIVQPLHQGGSIVSSSLIRTAISSGKVAEAAALLGRPYMLAGTVSRGAQRGRTIGFPTANLAQIETMLPADGVYAAIATVSGNKYQAAVSLGPNLTFADGTRKVEAHLLDVCVSNSMDIYGQEMQLRFIQHIRGLHKFTSVDKLQSQLYKDVARVRSALEGTFG